MDIITLALAKKSSKSYVDNKLDAITTDMDYKGSVSSVEDLPSTATAGDIYTVSGDRYLYNGTEWEKISTGGSGGTVDDALNGNSTNAVQNKVITDALNSKADIDGVYPKLVAGDLVESETRDDVFTYQVTDHTGKANINSIKGNTLVWNQLIEKGNMTDGWIFSNSTGSYANNILTFTASAQGGFVRPNLPQPIISGHKYLGTVDVKGTSAFSSNILFVGRSEGELNSVSVSTTWQTFAKVFTNTVTENNYFPRVSDRRSSGWDAVQVRNCMLIDLTQMGLDSITSVDEFTKLFPLSYYAYESGKLLSFNGTGLKTVGKNLCDNSTITVGYYTSQNLNDDENYKTSALIPVLPNTTYIATIYNKNKVSLNRLVYSEWDSNGNFIQQSLDTALTTSSNTAFVRIRNYSGQTSNILNDDYLYQLELGSTATSYAEYVEPSTLSLPISTYFPNGMRKANGAYDELTNSKATTRVKQIIFDGSSDEAWTVVTSTHRAYIEVSDIDTSTPDANVGNIMSNMYVAGNYDAGGVTDKITTRYNIAQINVFDSTNITTDSTANTWKAYLQEHPLIVNYGLATPTEEDVDLDLSYSNYEGGTEQLLPANTDVPVTSPISMNVEFDFGENLNARLNKMLSCLAQVEASPSTHNYSVGDYLMYEYQLYKVTSAITTGQSLTVGTNIVATTVMSELLSLTA